MSETWLTSDTHVGHERMAEMRHFTSVRAHDEAIVRNLVRRVGCDDHLWVLGDVALGNRVQSLRWFNHVPGRKHLVLGNHDRAHGMNRNAHVYLDEYLEFFDTVQTMATLRHQGQTVLLSHFPYDGEGADRPDEVDRATQWRLRDEGRLLMHGHVHDDVRFRESTLGSPMIHVGLDAWGLKPVTLHDALAAQAD
ncbi:metallophosphoesterase family protein [Ornithinimicrobium murale]|uniref:metallophosphoesterase family protein n=1 Tax=Ornithinimicrobium murale TaxID=1050153 RepID=UPI000E0CCDC9|nr:metallophosphoesterase family protein [Ornithinimicrobium murale]